MADAGYISKIKVPTGDIYSIRDVESREALDKKIFFDDRISGVSGYNDLSVIKLSADEYAGLLVSNALLSNALYIVEDSYINAYGQQIKSLAEATDLSDAVTLNQLQTVSTDLSNKDDELEGELNTISGQLSNYLLSSDVKLSYSDQILWLSSKSYVTSVDCADFIKDGILSTVELCSNQLIFNFNTDAGTNPISIALSNFIDEAQYWKKSETSSASEISIALCTAISVATDSVVPAIFKNVQLIKPRQPEGYRLHFRGDIARDDQFEDIVAANFDSVAQERWQFFKHFVIDGISGTWETMLSTGFYTDADDVPASFYFADALSSVGETPSISSQYFLRYFWYYELSGVERKSDQFSIAIPSNTAVGANPGDVVHKDEFYDLRQTVQPFKQTAGKETDYNQYYVCRPSIVTEISGALSGEFDVLLDDYEAGNIYRFQFLVGDADAYPKFYIDYGNGPEIATDLSINQDSYIFKAQARYYAEIQNDILKVDKFGYDGGSSLPSRYKLVTAELSSLNGSLCCMIEDHSITTIEISSSSTPVVVYLPEKANDGARDFIIRVEISSQTAPGFTFAGLDESMIFDSEDDDWAVLEPGLNLISFTETR